MGGEADAGSFQDKQRVRARWCRRVQVATSVQIRALAAAAAARRRKENELARSDARMPTMLAPAAHRR